MQEINRFYNGGSTQETNITLQLQTHEEKDVILFELFTLMREAIKYRFKILEIRQSLTDDLEEKFKKIILLDSLSIGRENYPTQESVLIEAKILGYSEEDFRGLSVMQNSAVSKNLAVPQ